MKSLLSMSVALAALTCAAPAFAQLPPAPGSTPEGRVARPQPQDLRVPEARPPVSEMSPELLRIMQNWERASAQIRTLEGKHTRFVYNSVFETEARTNGVFYYEKPDKGRIDMNGVEPGKNEISKRVGSKSGQPYRLEAGASERWICSGAEVMQINEKDRQYEAFPLPENVQGEKILNSPLPFLFGMKVADAQRRFSLTLMGENESIAKIKAVPLLDMDAGNYSEAMIMLDKRSYVPTAVQLIDPQKTIQSVYVFSEIKVNAGGIGKALAEAFGKDPFHPSLRGYKLVQPPPAAQNDQIQPAGGQLPSGGRSVPGASQGQPARTAQGFPGAATMRR